MFKKLIIFIIIFGIFPIITFASSNTGAKVGNEYYDNLEDAIKAAGPTDTVKLLSNSTLERGIIVEKILNIDMNGNTISAPTAVFEVQKGFLTLSGKGTIKELEPNYGAVRVIGSETPTGEKYSGVTIGKDITLEGWTGVFVSHKNNKSYGVTVNLDGKVNAVADTQGNPGIGVYVNGMIQDEKEHPEINISDTADINSDGVGLYIGGYSTFNLGKATIKGKEAGIGIKSGKLIIDGATVICDGKDETPTEGYTNGINASGTAIQIESNTGYAGDMEIKIKSGTIKSVNSNVIYEYVGKGTQTQVKSFTLTGGTYISEADKNVFLFSNPFKEKFVGFISGGEYSSNPNEHLIAGYTSTLDNDLYIVTKTTMANVDIEKSDGNNSVTIIIVTLLIIVLLIIGYINRNKILNLIKK